MAKPIGQMNGFWGLLFKFILGAAIPFGAYMVHCLQQHETHLAAMNEAMKNRDMRLANIEEANKEQWKAMNEVHRCAQKTRDLAEQNKSEIDRLRAGG